MQNNNSIMDEVTPIRFFLSQNYPNPFSEKTTIKYCMAYKTRVQIAVYNTEGEEIEKLVDEEKNPGTYEIEFSTHHSGESRNLADGHYFYRMTAGDFTSEKKWLCINKLSGRFNMKTLLQTLFFFFIVTQIVFAQWYQQNSGTTMHLNAVSFIDENRGFVVGDNGTILRTTNGGDLWGQVPSGTPNHLHAISITSDSVVTVVGASGTILRTSDRGESWFSQTSGTTMNLNGVQFIGSNIGMVVGGVGGVVPPWVVGGTILRTSTGGATWIPVFSDTTKRPKAIWMMNADTATVVGWADSLIDVILRTTDAGTSWSAFSSDADMQLLSVSYIDESYGFAVGGIWGLGEDKWGVIVKTTDGGNTWFSVRSIRYHLFNSAHFVNSNTGWLATRTGYIFRTANGGQDLEEQFRVVDPYSPWSLNSIVMTDVLHGWCVGLFGLILHTTNGGVSFVEEQELDEVPTEFLLSQNYPNPFNPQTSIQYAVSSRKLVTLKVYDVLGKEVEILVNEEKPAGTYEVTWYAEQLPSGVYFYQLKAGEYIDTKKMLLLK